MKKLVLGQTEKVIVSACRILLPTDETYFALTDEAQLITVCRRRFECDRKKEARHIYWDDTSHKGVLCIVVGWARNMQVAREIAAWHREMSERR